MATTNVITQTGNRVLITCDGVEVGMAQSLRCSDDYGLQPVSGIGDIHIKENVPSMAHHSLALSAVALRTKSLEQLGVTPGSVVPENGDAILKGFVFDIAVMDKDTNQALVTYQSCSYANGDIEYAKHAITMRNANFIALDKKGKMLPGQ